MCKLSRADEKRRNLEMLNYIVKICEENELTYFAYAGTLLGAIRHQGFIPWDDDIDILLFRKEYEQLGALISSDRYKNLDFDNKYDFIGSALQDLKTIGCLHSHKNIVRRGIAVDYAPLDFISNYKIIAILKTRVLCRLYHLTTFGNRDVKTYNFQRFRMIKKMIVILSSRFFNNKRKSRIRNFIYNRINLSEKKYIGIIGSASYKWGGNIYKFEDYRKVLKVDFEDVKINIPAGWESSLCSTFDKNYMQIPPKDKRKRHYDEYHWRN